MSSTENPTTPLGESTETAQTRARLIRKFTTDGDLMSLGIAVARVVEMTSSEEDGSQDLTYYVLADVALTQKVLRLANAVAYRSISNTPITTVSRAIYLLGFDAVRTTAMALLLVESLADKPHADAVRKELVESLCASIIGRELARHSHVNGAEEASIAALFNNLGRMLMVSYEHELYERIEARCEKAGSPAQAAIDVMGCSYEFLTETVLREWNFPPTLVLAHEPIPPGVVKLAANRQTWMRQVVSFSAEASKVVLQAKTAVSAARAESLLTRYGKALNLDHPRLTSLLELVGREIAQVVNSLNLTRPEQLPGIEQRTNTLPSALKLAVLDVHVINTTECFDSGKPICARDLLLAGVQVATQMLGMANYKPRELVTLVVETLFSSLGFRFATLCLRDKSEGVYRAKVSMGADHLARQRGFVFPLASAEDIFHLSMENSAELMLEDAYSPNVRNLLPEWHKQLIPDARSIMVLPLVQDGVQLGVFYAERPLPAPEGLTSDEAALVKTLVGQMMVALKPR